MSEIFASCKDEFEKPQNQTWQKLETFRKLCFRGSDTGTKSSPPPPAAAAE